MVFIPEVGEFFIHTNDYALADTVEYNQFIDKLEAELFDQTHCRVIFGTHFFETTSPQSMFEINNFSPQEEANQEIESLVRSAT